jgi:hypothetical protein
VIAPALAGTLMVRFKLQGIVVLDVLTFVFAILMTGLARASAPGSAPKSREPFASEVAAGWRFVAGRPGLIWLLVFFFLINLNLALANALITPLILNFGNPALLGWVLSAAAVGMLLGSAWMVIWGGPARRVDGILAGAVLFGVCLGVIGRTSSPIVMTLAFGVLLFGIPIVNSCSQAIWQAKTPLPVQGRVFAFETLVAWSAAPVAYLAAGPLVDRVFGRLLEGGGGLARALQQVVGPGPARNVGLAFVAAGVGTLLATLACAWVPRLRRLEAELPDAELVLPGLHDEGRLPPLRAEVVEDSRTGHTSAGSPH